MLGRGLARRTGDDFIDLKSIEAFDAVADETERDDISQSEDDRGKAVRQTAGQAPGWYLADGAGDWQRIGDGRERNAQHVDVRDYGAACDGTVDGNGGTDDTAAVQAAIEDCESTGRVLHFPGFCMVTDEIVSTARIRIEGKGVGGIRQTNASARCLVFAPAENGVAQSIDGMTLSGGRISLDWSNENGATYTHGGLSHMRWCQFLPAGGSGSKAIHVGISLLGARLSQLFIYGTWEYGIDASNGVTDLLGNTAWDNVNITGGNSSVYGIRATGGGAPATSFRSLIIEGCAGAAMHLENADFTLICPHFEANGMLRDEADIELYSVVDGATAPGQLIIIGGAFSGLGAAQSSSKRIEFTSTHCNIMARDVGISTDHVLETNGNETGCSISWEGGLPTLSPTDWGGALTHNNAGSVRTQALSVNSIAARDNGSIAVDDPLSGVLRFTDGVPAVDLASGLASGANARVLSVGVNANAFGVVNAAYDTACVLFETRNPYSLVQFLGNAAGGDTEVLLALGQRGYVFRHGGMVAAGATGNKTIHKASGSIRIAAGQQSAVLTNNLIKFAGLYNTQIFAQLMTDDATATSVVVTRGSGACTFKLNDVATAEVEIAWQVYDCGDEVFAGPGGELKFNNVLNSGHI